MQSVGVLIPVFNNFTEAAYCLQSVFLHTPEDIPLLIIDDASTDGDFEEYITSSFPAVPSHITFRRNETNLGFTRTVNLGLEELHPHDVILLNSDTEVTPGWIEKLQQAAYSREKVGSVTPLTNNGTVCSVPRFCEENAIPHGYDAASFGALIEEVSQSIFPELPTCVGFCTYLRREALDAVGVLDEEHFPRGYGEENDLSCRFQQNGFVDLLADNTFVAHAGGGSFQAEAERLRAEGEKQLRRLHPNYYPQVARFIRENPLFPIQHRIQTELLKRGDAKSEGRILHILHNGPYKARRDPLGGTELHVQALIRELPNFSHWSLVRDRNSFILEAHNGDYSASFSARIENAADIQEQLFRIIDPQFFSLVHVHHLRWFDLDSLAEALLRHGNYIVSLHDFVAICPRFHLFTVEGNHCSGTECQTACGFSAPFISQYRNHGLRILQGSKRNIAFSENTLKYHEQILGEKISATTVQHGIFLPSERPETTQRTIEESNSPLCIATYAPRGKHKGAEIFNELFQVTELPSGQRVRWVVFGEWEKVSGGSEEVVGSFQHEDLPKLMREVAPDLGLLFSLCPETYGLAFDEFLACGVPLVVSPLGAPAERVLRWDAGWVVDQMTPSAIISVIDGLAQDRAQLQSKQRAAHAAPVRTFAEEADELQRVYQQLSSEQSAGLSFNSFTEQFLAGEPQRSLLARRFGAYIDSALGVLERMGLRSFVHHGLQSLLGNSSFERLKNLRG